MKKIIVTGGSGFIGTNLINHFKKNGDEILSLDISNPKIDSHKKLWKKVDLCDYEKLEESILNFKPEFVIHLGARTDLNGIHLDDYAANIKGVENLLTILDKTPTVQRVVFASSMYVTKPGYQPSNFEDYLPHTVYGESKVLTEKLIKEKKPDYTWCIIRPTSIWGPYFGEPYNLFFKIVLGKKYFHLGERACKKTYGYIDNFIFQVQGLLDLPSGKINGNVFYLGDYEPYNIADWAEEIAEVGSIKIPTVPFFIFKIAANFGDLLKYLGIKFPMTSFRLNNMTTNNIHNLEPIKKLLPVLPVNRKEGTKITVEWMKNN